MVSRGIVVALREVYVRDGECARTEALEALSSRSDDPIVREVVLDGLRRDEHLFTGNGGRFDHLPDASLVIVHPDCIHVAISDFDASLNHADTPVSSGN